MEIINRIGHEMTVALMGMVPFIEVKGAIPMGLAMGLKPLESLFFSLLGNVCLIPVLLLVLRPAFHFLRQLRYMGPVIEKIERNTLKKSKKYERFSLFGLFFLVALPVPGTGVYTGCLAASLLDIRFKHALPIVAAGAVVAGLLIFLFFLPTHFFF